MPRNNLYNYIVMKNPLQIYFTHVINCILFSVFCSDIIKFIKGMRSPGIYFEN